MSPRTRGVGAVLVAALVFAILTWLDAAVLARGRAEALATFNIGSFVWLGTFGTVAIAAAAILFGGLAWWSRSLLASAAFLIGGAAETLVLPVVYSFTGDWPLGLNQALIWWLTTTTGPLNAANVLGAALVVAGVIGLYRWAFTRRLAVVDR
ncbi:MAG: hypothetical protein QOJ81_32 [Chloroflexota bacterium]|jgi:hypothetical protein|nr:hypothetical protein [Chloroflexota bacterium]